MTSFDSQQFESYVPVFDTMPDTWDEAKITLVEHLKKISNAVNLREIGWYLDEELLSGKQFYPPTNSSGTSQQYRSILRKVVNFGDVAPIGIPLGTKTVPHGLNFDANFTLMNLYGAATDPINFFAINLGHVAAAPNQVELFINGTDIVTVSGVDRSAYSRVYIVIEYIQEL